MREERHLEQQTLAVVAHDVAVLGCQLWSQQVWADTDLPQVVKRPVVQFEADPRLGTDGIESWRSCQRWGNKLLCFVHKQDWPSLKVRSVTYRHLLMPRLMPGGKTARFQAERSVCSWCPACAASLHLLWRTRKQKIRFLIEPSRMKFPCTNQRDIWRRFTCRMTTGSSKDTFRVYPWVLLGWTSSVMVWLLVFVSGTVNSCPFKWTAANATSSGTSPR